MGVYNVGPNIAASCMNGGPYYSYHVTKRATRHHRLLGVQDSVVV